MTNIADVDLDSPWIPAGAPTFKVGDRVICRPSPECRINGEPGSTSRRNSDLGHAPDLEGKTGRIVDINDLAIPGHPYNVRIDGGYVYDCLPWTEAIFAAIELELLPDEVTR